MPTTGAPLWAPCVRPLALFGAKCISLPAPRTSSFLRYSAEMLRSRMNYELDLDIAPRPRPRAPLHGSNH